MRLQFLHLFTVFLAVAHLTYADNKNDSSSFSVWIETVVGFNPMILVAYDILTNEETRMSQWDQKSLENIPLKFYQEENHDITEEKAPLIEKVMMRNMKPLTKTLRDPNFGLYIEKWMNILRQSEVENLKTLRKVLARREINRTFKEMDTLSKKDKAHPINPSDFKEVITQSLESLVTALSDKTSDENEIVAASYVGACAKVLLLKLQEKESDDFNLYSYLMKFTNDDECNPMDVQKRANRLMAVVNSGILLEAILINKGILETNDSHSSEELHELYRRAEQKVNALLAKCETFQ